MSYLKKHTGIKARYVEEDSPSTREGARSIEVPIPLNGRGCRGRRCPIHREGEGARSIERARVPEPASQDNTGGVDVSTLPQLPKPDVHKAAQP
jgi:hypothetical protein